MDFTRFHRTAIIIMVEVNMINHKGGERMVQEMSDKELITITIDRYAELQRFKQANGNQENK